MQSQAMSPTACYDDSLVSKRAVAVSPVESHKTRSPQASDITALSSLALSVGSTMIILGSLHTLCETLHDPEILRSRDQNHGGVAVV